MNNSILNFKCVFFLIIINISKIFASKFNISYLVIVSVCFVGIDLFTSYTGSHVAENKIQTDVCQLLVFMLILKYIFLKK